MRLALLLLVSVCASAEPPADVLEFFRTAADALATDDASAFLDKFDRSLPVYATLRTEVEGLLAAYDVGSTIEVVSDEGDEQKRYLELDWLLLTSEKAANQGGSQSRRRVVKCWIERHGKQWKITAIEPTDFFKY